LAYVHPRILARIVLVLDRIKMRCLVHGSNAHWHDVSVMLLA